MYLHGAGVGPAHPRCQHPPSGGASLQRCPAEPEDHLLHTRQTGASRPSQVQLSWSFCLILLPILHLLPASLWAVCPPHVFWLQENCPQFPSNFFYLYCVYSIYTYTVYNYVLVEPDSHNDQDLYICWRIILHDWYRLYKLYILCCAVRGALFSLKFITCLCVGLVFCSAEKWGDVETTTHNQQEFGTVTRMWFGLSKAQTKRTPIPCFPSFSLVRFTSRAWCRV